MKRGDTLTCVDASGTQHLTRGKDYLCIWVNEFEVSVRNDIQRETSYDVDRFKAKAVKQHDPLDVVAETLYRTNTKGTNEETISWSKVHAQVKRRYREMARAMIALFGEDGELR